MKIKVLFLAIIVREFVSTIIGGVEVIMLLAVMIQFLHGIKIFAARSKLIPADFFADPLATGFLKKVFFNYNKVSL